MFVTRACSSSQAVQHSEARSSCMPVFFFGDTSGSKGQRPPHHMIILLRFIFNQGTCSHCAVKCRRQLGQSALRQETALMAFADQMCGITVEYVSLHLASAPTFSLTVQCGFGATAKILFILQFLDESFFPVTATQRTNQSKRDLPLCSANQTEW